MIAGAETEFVFRFASTKTMSNSQVQENESLDSGNVSRGRGNVAGTVADRHTTRSGAQFGATNVSDSMPKADRTGVMFSEQTTNASTDRVTHESNPQFSDPLTRLHANTPMAKRASGSTQLVYENGSRMKAPSQTRVVTKRQWELSEIQGKRKELAD